MTEAVALARPSVRHAGRALRLPAYRWWFASQTLSASGTFTQAVAQSWLVLTVTGHAVDLGLLAVAAWSPVLLLGAWAGALVDRWDRRRVLAVTQTALIALAAAQAVLVLDHAITLRMIYAFAAATGVAGAFDFPARQAYVYELVGPDRIASAVGLYEVMLNASRIIGPAVGGVLLATIGIGPCFLANGASYLPVLVVLARFRPPPRPPRERAAGLGLREGVRTAFGDPVIRACVLVAMAGGMLFNLGVTVPILTTRVFGLGPGGFGAMMAMFGVGAVPGAVVAASTARHPDARTIHALAGLTGLSVLATALSPVPAGAYAAMAASGFLSIWLIALATTLVQLRAGEHRQGRVMGIWTMSMTGLAPFTAMLTGLVADRAGGRVAFALSGVAFTLVTAATWRTLRSAR